MLWAAHRFHKICEVIWFLYRPAMTIAFDLGLKQQNKQKKQVIWFRNSKLYLVNGDPTLGKGVILSLLWCFTESRAPDLCLIGNEIPMDSEIRYWGQTLFRDAVRKWINAMYTGIKLGNTARLKAILYMHKLGWTCYYISVCSLFKIQ